MTYYSTSTDGFPSLDLVMDTQGEGAILTFVDPKALEHHHITLTLEHLHTLQVLVRNVLGQIEAARGRARGREGYPHV